MAIVDENRYYYGSQAVVFVHVKGGHFEHKMSQYFRMLLLLITPDISGKFLLKGCTIKANGVQ